MKICGLGAGAWVIILQALATYAAVGSAYLLARPVLRNQVLDGHRDVLASVSAASTEVDALFAQAKEILAQKAQAGRKRTASDNRWGAVLLVLSVVLFTVAVALQVRTDPAFHRAGVAAPTAEHEQPPAAGPLR